MFGVHATQLAGPTIIIIETTASASATISIQYNSIKNTMRKHTKFCTDTNEEAECQCHKEGGSKHLITVIF